MTHRWCVHEPERDYNSVYFERRCACSQRPECSAAICSCEAASGCLLFLLHLLHPPAVGRVWCQQPVCAGDLTGQDSGSGIGSSLPSAARIPQIDSTMAAAVLPSGPPHCRKMQRRVVCVFLLHSRYIRGWGLLHPAGVFTEQAGASCQTVLSLCCWDAVAASRSDGRRLALEFLIKEYQNLHFLLTSTGGSSCESVPQMPVLKCAPLQQKQTSF